ncbi:1,4-dihydroxy-2-naphthoate polyprenyltransferase [Naasia aerilata]|uniref:1,4-dihydroxy-2-naphthoate octaprenyltransferase n=1 Tax=Naasia aerilata TaxID=1162966 RepID=A0ABN6XL04_9MICO|nr:1,4-dihydroxy-2-naphthoate polyprenyltransferase [Naasia aerilata]BDZ45599.1 1,4-dihydroxy-2-naphthoate octaprenyltransferase [Naasia aerilata]
MAQSRKRPPSRGARPAGKPSVSKGPANRGRPGRPAARVAPPRKATVADWVAASRWRTLPLSIAPVAAGTGAAVVADGGVFHEYRIPLCLAVALFLQLGVNYANDYSDGIRGTDDYRVGPARLTASGAAKPRTVLTVALAFLALAAVAGLALVVLSQQWWLLAVGAAAIAAAWFYTGGKRPYGYAALGEVGVFVFFGLVATCGTTFVQAGEINTESWLSGVGIGFLACAALIANNIRDIEQDRRAGKRTLSVLIGPVASRVLYCVLLLLAFAIVGFFAIFYPFSYLVFFALLIAIPAGLIVATGRTAREFVLALALTSALTLVYGVGLAAAFIL